MSPIYDRGISQIYGKVYWREGLISITDEIRDPRKPNYYAGMFSS